MCWEETASTTVHCKTRGPAGVSHIRKTNESLLLLSCPCTACEQWRCSLKFKFTKSWGV